MRNKYWYGQDKMEQDKMCIDIQKKWSALKCRGKWVRKTMKDMMQDNDPKHNATNT